MPSTTMSSSRPKTTTTRGGSSALKKRITLFEDVVSFWRNQLHFSVAELQKALLRSPTLEDSHAVYVQLVGVEDCLRRIYNGSDAFYAAIVEDRGVPLPAICQVCRQHMHACTRCFPSVHVPPPCLEPAMSSQQQHTRSRSIHTCQLLSAWRGSSIPGLGGSVLVQPFLCCTCFDTPMEVY